MTDEFPVLYADILARLEGVNPVEYGITRNYLTGKVSRLSPYISRGVISLVQIKEHLLSKYPMQQCQRFIQELAWREYFQRVWQEKGDGLFEDLRNPQQKVDHYGIAKNIVSGTTGIDAIDEGIRQLYATGYMHNHMRLYVASVATNIGRAHWLKPAKWLYYNLLDADPASNHLSWQWVAGAFSIKKYYCNQQNINHFSNSFQKGTYLDKSNDELENVPVPQALAEVEELRLETPLPVTVKPMIDPLLPTMLYTVFNLDPLWRANEKGNRVLVLEPSFFSKFPSGQKFVEFITSLASNIEGLQVYAGEINELSLSQQSTFFKEHPTCMHYPGSADSRDWLFPDIKGYFPSFSSFWKRCQKTMVR